MHKYLIEVFQWSYENDRVLYDTLDQEFDARTIRCRMTEEDKEMMAEKRISNQKEATDYLIQSISLSDYEDTLKFRRSFNKGLNDYQNAEEFITRRQEDLASRGMNEWHRSEDEAKHKHFRFWMNHLKGDKGHVSLRFFVVNSGNVRPFDTLYAGTNEEQIFQAVIDYILENKICPDPHHKKLEVPDFVNPDYYNPRYITSSGRFGGFHYLVYLTAEELKEIYRTKINRKRLHPSDKAMWGFINSTSTEQETKFYLFMT